MGAPVEVLKGRKVTVWSGTWNVGAKDPFEGEVPLFVPVLVPPPHPMSITPSLFPARLGAGWVGTSCLPLCTLCAL